MNPAAAPEPAAAMLPLHLLVVDDDDVDRERVLRLLAGSPYLVHARQAASGAEALAAVREQRFDCVVLDHHLGDTTGAELLPQLRAETRSEVPVIMVTGAGNESLAVQALHQGAADYLPKPQLSRQSLVHSIERSLERQQLKREVAQLQQQLERRLDEQAATIRQRERDLHNILDNAPAMIGYWDAELRLRLGNKAYQQWFGVRPEQMPGLPIQQLLDAARLREAWPHIQGALSGAPQRFERRMPGAGDAAAGWAQVEYRPDVDEDGRVLGFYVTLIDITPVKAAQARAEELLRFSEAVIHTAPVGISVYQADGQCVITNAVAAHLAGLSLAEMRLRNVRGSAAWQQTGLLAQADATLADGLPRQLALAWPAVGPRAAAHVEVSLARVDRGGRPHLLVMARDITEQRQVLDAMAAARDAAEDAARTKSAFLANMSHEIRTPMNAIIGLSRLARDEALAEPARTYVDKVHASAVALMGILDDVLDYSKIEAGQMRFEQLPLDLTELLQRVAGLFIARIEQKGLHLQVDRAHDLPRGLVGDALRLSQVLNNLVGNAVKFTERGGIAVLVWQDGPVADGQVRLRFEVRDSGIGIEPAQQAALFEAFSQGDSSITRRFGGSGLGLAICKRLVEMMGGEIGVDSTPGVGSRFWFTARLAVADVAELAPPVAPPEPGVLPPGLRVLLVEDNELNQMVASQFLQRLGAVVALACDGAQAVALVRQAGAGSFDAVLMDLHMPVMDGLEATRRIHALPGCAGLPVIGMTAAALPEDRARCIAAGMVSHVAKPVMPERLLQALREGLQTGAAAAVPVAPAAVPAEVLDLAGLRRRLGGNEPLVWRLIGLFVQREAQVADTLRGLIAQGDLDAARLRAHDLKGSAATLGLMALSQAAAALETALRAGTPDAAGAQALLADLDRALQGALAALAAHPGGSGGGSGGGAGPAH
ncbi:response regulator [Aquabacterium sp.]|uniref:response regulator n=1 Tax=Aquabacterium sp. TaxID=1872578 RepID=UPI0037840787